MNIMHASESGIEFIQRWEGFRANAYQCSAGRWTIGRGSTVIAGKPVAKGQKITREAAADQLRADVLEIDRRLCCCTDPSRISQAQWDALVSFVYNLGIGAFEGSTLRRFVNAGKMNEASGEFQKWCKANDPKTGQLVELAGLKKRRAAEQKLWDSGCYQ